ncbi:MAG: TetR/AcrR family transcriptional regulator [Bacillota bacterium]|nr:TetR/AcrR family transcriptional regulator [Bacillota bacterium]
MNNIQRSAQTRATILSAATLRIATDGYAFTGVAEICEQAGVSKGAFYYHFESKESVFLELIDTWLTTLEENLEDAVNRADNVLVGMLEMAGKMQDLFISNQVLMGLFLELWTHANRNEKVRSATLAPYRRYQKIFSRFVSRGIEQKVIAPVDPETTGQLLLSLSSGLFLQASLNPEGENWGKKLQDSINILFEGLKRRD